MENREIAVETEKLKNAARTERKTAAAMSEARNSLKKISAELDSDWESDMKTRFAEGCAGIILMAGQLETAITKRAAALENSVAAYEETEGKTESDVDDLSTDNIF